MAAVIFSRRFLAPRVVISVCDGGNRFYTAILSATCCALCWRFEGQRGTDIVVV